MKMWGESERGVSFVFGQEIISNFLRKNELDLVCRAHQVVETYAAEIWLVVWLVQLRQLGQVADLPSEESVQRLHYTYYIQVTNELHS